METGTRLGAYEILRLLGSGGMGQVYRARDTRLGRDVALKIVPPHLANDAERLARLRREAQVLASLNHPQIATIHGLEEAEGTQFLVLELVDGQTLADLIASGPLPLGDALAIARQIAEALEAAHAAGIIHRDLKPANIALTKDGRVKVLDFGLAKAVESIASTTPGHDLLVSPSMSPTLTSPAILTGVGLIVGTAAYMAPEQARGKPVDRRADIWAFGCIVYEMLTGRRPFEGDDITEVLARVIEREPDLTALPRGTPESIRRLLRRTFAKSRSARLADAHDALLEIDDAMAGVDVAPVPPGRPQSRLRTALLWSVAVLLPLVLVPTLVMVRRSAPDAPVMRYDIPAPPKTSLAVALRPGVTISRDGRLTVFAASAEGGTELYLRRRDETEVRPLAGTDLGSNPVFSPDGTWLAFFAGRQLKKMRIGEAPVSLAPISDSRGVTWVDDQTLVYAPEAAAGLFKIAADGGTPRAITTIDGKRGERTHRWPAALPGGRAVLFTVGSSASPDDYNDAELDAVILATGERRKILSGASFATYIPTGHLIYLRNGVLYALRFDPERLTTSGTAIPVLQGVGGDVTTGAGAFAAADDGTLVYVGGTGSSNANLRRLVWVNRRGDVEDSGLPPGIYNDQRLAPDGSRAALVVGASGSGDVWMFDVRRKTFTRFTFDGKAATPVWSQDGRTVYFASIDAASDTTTLLAKPADGSRDAVPVATIKARAFLAAVNGSGTSALIELGTGTAARMTDILTLPLEPGSQPTPIVATTADEYGASVTRDGRWLAYQSNESGRYEIYVRDVSGTGARWQISTTGGEEPRWSADGTELLYRVDNRLMRVPITVRPQFEAGAPQLWVNGIYNLRSDTGVSYGIESTSGRLLMTRLADATDAGPVTTINVVLNWFGEVRRLVSEANK